jgi:hypothetical protein
MFEESHTTFSENYNEEYSFGPFQIRLKDKNYKWLSDPNRNADNKPVIPDKEKSLGDRMIDAGFVTDVNQLLSHDLDYHLDLLIKGMNSVGDDLREEADSMEFAMYKLVTTVFVPKAVVGKHDPNDPAVKAEVQNRLATIRRSGNRNSFRRLPTPEYEEPTGDHKANRLEKGKGQFEIYGGD